MKLLSHTKRETIPEPQTHTRKESQMPDANAHAQAHDLEDHEPRYLSKLRSTEPGVLFADVPEFYAFLKAVDHMKSGDMGPFAQKFGELCEEASLPELGLLMTTFPELLNDALEASDLDGRVILR